jgi:ArsR family transcriptional regulator
MGHPDADYFARVFKALADGTRQQILELLRRNGEMTVTDIAAQFDLAQPTISQHLRVLKEVEALKTRRAGQHIFYRICNIELYDAIEAFMDTYEQQTRGKTQ